MAKARKKSYLTLERVIIGSLLLLLVVASCALIFLIKTKEMAIDEAYAIPLTQETEPSDPVASFPIGVDPLNELIVENPEVPMFLEQHLSRTDQRKEKQGWLAYITSRLTQYAWYQNLASASSRILVIEPGERKEQVIENFGDILGWSALDRELFEALIISTDPATSEGTFFPGHYVTHKDATPEEVADLLLSRFETEVKQRYSSDIAELVSLEDTLILASLLEREAYTFEDMRHIAGVIWNRLFIDMGLQIDASLQYAKASEYGGAWWPPVVPDDKYIDSPFNTYQNKGLPPAPIANPSVAAIIAALNPKETECIFYFHDQEGDFYCTETYEEHVRMLREVYGQGR